MLVIKIIYLYITKNNNNKYKNKIYCVSEMSLIELKT